MAKSEAKATDHAELKGVALSVFNQMTSSVGRGLVHKATALEAFRRAKVFLECSDEIEMGMASAEPIPADIPEDVDVPVLVQNSEEKWSPLMDPITNRQVVQKMPVDRYAYAPNLPENHPVNVRFKPHDGVRPTQRHKPQLTGTN